jgi:hypothetical protein
VPIGTQLPETDLWVPQPEPGDHWDPHTIHTHYFGFSIAEAELGAFLYLRWQPAFPLCGAGVCIFRGMDNVHLLDMDYLDYEVTMPWPEVNGNRIATRNGFQIEFLEPGVQARVSYASSDGVCSFDMVQTAISPLVARGHVMPGEEHHHDEPGTRGPGGSEQFMRVEGEITLDGQTWTMDPYAVRDRSWSQVRTETRGAVNVPPMAWTPACFDGEMMLNQIGIDAPDTDPAWKELYDVPADAPTHHWAWIAERGGEARGITRVHRNVLEYHPRLHAATKQVMEVEDEAGRTYRFTGEAYAMAAVPGWPNLAAAIGVYRWEDERGRISDQTYQEIAFDRYFREMTRRGRQVAKA